MWRDGMLTQAAAAWLLGCVFVRFLEDNGLVEEALLSGPQQRRRLAAERQMQYFQRRPTDSDRDYLYEVFRTVQRLPAVTTLFDARHNPVWAYGISGDAAKELIAFWRQVVPETGELVHDFTDATGTPASWAISIRTCPRTPASATPCCRPPSSSRSLSSTAPSNPAIAAFGLKDVAAASTRPAVRAIFCSGRSSVFWIGGCASSPAPGSASWCNAPWMPCMAWT